jgi:hypothetical protein
MIFCLLSLAYEPTRISSMIGTSVWLFHTMTTPWCSELRGYATLQQPVQSWAIAPLPAWLVSTVASLTQHLHNGVAKSPRQCHCKHYSTTPSPAWLDIYIAQWPSRLSSVVASMTRQHHRRHDSASTLHHDQVASTAPLPTWLGSSMTWHIHCTMAK